MAGAFDGLALGNQIVMVAGTPPIRGKKAKYYQDARFNSRILPPPDPAKFAVDVKTDDWSGRVVAAPQVAGSGAATTDDTDEENAGIRREPDLPDHVAIEDEATDKAPLNEFDFDPDPEPDEAATRQQNLNRQVRGIARQVALDPNDGIDM